MNARSAPLRDAGWAHSRVIAWLVAVIIVEGSGDNG